MLGFKARWRHWAHGVVGSKRNNSRILRVLVSKRHYAIRTNKARRRRSIGLWNPGHLLVLGLECWMVHRGGKCRLLEVLREVLREWLLDRLLDSLLDSLRHRLIVWNRI